jgi:imidazolonepropionase-like amidohydrolase
MVGLPLGIALAIAAPQAAPQSAGAELSKISPPAHGIRPASLLIKDVMVIRGNGTPPFGPTDVLLKGNRIESVEKFRGGENGLPAAVIDGKGKYLLPGFVNLHGHVQESRGGLAIPNEYQFGLWLACGITTIRNVGTDFPFEHLVELRDKSSRNEIPVPRIWAYAAVANGAPETLRAQVRELKQKGADGLKIFTMDRDALEAVMDEARKLDLPCTTHMGVEETNALDCCRLGMTSIEHWYGIPDAALVGPQHFPPGFSYSNEVDRFRYAGRLWREANPEMLESVLQSMVNARLAWDPTLAIYEASRDLTRAQNQPWFESYLHPGLQKFFEPNLENHGSYFLGWTTSDEIAWKENYRIWMGALKRFGDLGGTITCGEDAGFIYEMYGFCYLRELELHEEAGFQQLEVITQATLNGARVLGAEDRIGRVRAGHLADLVLVDGDPLGNLRLLYPKSTETSVGGGATRNVDGRAVPAGGIEWTIKDGVPYHGPTLLERVRAIVREARASPQPATTINGGGASAGCCAGAAAGG